MDLVPWSSIPLLPDPPTWLPAALTVVILVATVVSFAREKQPVDVTALFALLALLLTGVLTVGEAFAGFSHPATVSVAGVLVLSAGLERTGALRFLVRRFLHPIAGSEFLLTLVLMIVIAVTSAFVNNTAAVAVFIPVVLDVCRSSGLSPGRILMPMSHAATLGGMCTLIGTSTNLAAHEYARSQGLEGFGMFELGKVALPMAVVGFVYMLLLGRWFLPRAKGAETGVIASPGSYLAALIVDKGSPWIGRPLDRARLERDLEIELVDVLRAGTSILDRGTEVALEAGDRLRVRADLDQLLALPGSAGLAIHRPAVSVTIADPDGEAEVGKEREDSRALHEVVVLPMAGVVGRTLRSARFSEIHDCVVLAIHRPGGELVGRPEDITIRAGDVLVIEGEPGALAALADVRGYYFVRERTAADVRPGRVGIAVATLAAVVVAAGLGWMPIVTAATAGCLLLIVTRCLKPAEAYRAIDLRIVFLLAGSLALCAAVEKTGLAALVGSLLAGLAESNGPYAVLVAFFLVAMVLSELMSNSGTVLLLAPVAFAAATSAGIAPEPLLVAVAFGASASFAMPVGYQTNLMIYGPGGYRFADFVRMGLPLDILLAIVALLLVPRVWPLTVP